MIYVSTNISISDDDIGYKAIRASGSGGQHVNKTSSAIQLSFNAKTCTTISPAIYRRLKEHAGRRMTEDGILMLRAEAHSSQHRNREEALARLINLIKQSEKPQKHRKATRPTKASKERRLSSKAQASARKKTRGKVRNFD